MPQDKSTHEHSARLQDPGKYVRVKTGEDAGGKGVNFIYGIRKSEGPKGGKSEVQAIRFDAKKWSPSEAKKWLKDHNKSYLSFHAATIKEDGAPATPAPAPAATSGGPTITTSNIGAKYAPKVLPMTSHYGDFGIDQYDQSFMKKMKKKLNESVVEEGFLGKALGWLDKATRPSPEQVAAISGGDPAKVKKYYEDVDAGRKKPSAFVGKMGEAVEYYRGMSDEEKKVIDDLPQKEIYTFEATLRAVGGNIKKAFKYLVDKARETNEKIPYALVKYAVKNGWIENYAMAEGFLGKALGWLDKATRPSPEEVAAISGGDPAKVKKYYEDVDAGRKKPSAFVGRMSEDLSLTPDEKSLLEIIKAHADNKMTIDRKETKLVDKYFNLCLKGYCNWQFGNANKTVTFAID